MKWTLPDAHTDFIIAVAAEEFGLILCVVIMALYMTVVVRSLLRLVRERDPFIRLAGTGLAVLLGMQAMINIGVAVRLLPAKGMTLPLISYGGSSLIAAGLGLGVLLAMTRKRPQHEIDDILGAGALSDAPLLVIAAGGTGGHMFPAQALAEEMLARGWRVRLATDARGARYAGGFPPEVERRATAVGDLRPGQPRSTRATAPFAIAAGAAASVLAMRRERPACVAGFGGYPALPAMIAARALKMPLPDPRAERRARAGQPRSSRRGSTSSPAAPGRRRCRPARRARAHAATRCAPRCSPGTARPMSSRATGRWGCWSSAAARAPGSSGGVVPEALRLLEPDLRARLRLAQQVRPEDMDRVRAVYDGHRASRPSCAASSRTCRSGWPRRRW